nr:uncharacterized protein LOC123769273 [Procambarus clarkii]
MAPSLDGDRSPHRPTQPPPRTDGRVIADRMPSFTDFDATFMVISMGTFAVDVCTDLNLVIRYYLSGSLIWASLTLALVLVPAIIVMVLSMRWHIVDEHPVTKCYWATHICLWGIMHRYIIMFKTGLRLKARKTLARTDFDELYRQQSDVCMLRMFESFMESAPQLILQLYIMMSYNDYSIWTGITAFTSMLSVGWGIAAYTKAMRNTRLDKHKMTLSGLVLQTLWRVGMLSARVSALALVATILEAWILLIMGLHLIAMFVWVVNQKTGFSSTKWEESIFNFIMAVTYCFCFFNLREGPSRWRMVTFYTITAAENLAFVLTYFLMAPHKLWLKYTALAVVVGGMTVGLSCMVLYYRFFHPMGPLNPFKNESKEAIDAEKGTLSSGKRLSPSPDCNANTRHEACRVSVRREFKYMYPVVSKSSNSVLSAPGVSLESSPASNGTTPVSSSHLQEHQRPSGVMCSVQDLLANVSCSSDIQIVAPLNGKDSEDKVLSDNVNRYGEDEATEEKQESSPSSLERTVNRELNVRFSSSEFKDVDNTQEIPLEVRTNENITNMKATEQCCNQIRQSETYPFQTESSQKYYCQVGIPDECQYHTARMDVLNQQEVVSKSDDAPLSVDSQKKACGSIYHSLIRLSSPNCIGLPHKLKSSSQTGLSSLQRSSSHLDSTSILRTSVRKKGYTVSETDLRLTSLPHFTTSTINVTSKSQNIDHECSRDPSIAKPHIPNVELAVIDRMHIIEVESSGMSSEDQSDYENIYERKNGHRQNLPPKPLNLVMENLNETRTTQSSVPHDYENICAININREMWGVRHWKTYSDIEDKDRIHDGSTYKDRLKILDSTLTSSFLSEYSMQKGIQNRRSISITDDCESMLSRSLPDLSALRLETCLEEPEEEMEDENIPPEVKDDQRLMDALNQLRANRPINKSNSVDNIPNYETIWVGDVEKPENDNVSSVMTSTNSKSSLVVTIGDVRAQESLCNLYYSTMSDLSFRYYSERMRRNNSVGSLASRRSTRDTSREMIRTVSVPDSKTLLEVSELIEEERKMEEEKQSSNTIKPGAVSVNRRDPGMTPVTSGACFHPRRKFSMLRERFEHPNWTPLKSPLKQRQSAQRRNSLQDRTAKALQAGMKVFRRPRVHVITPKKDENKDTPRLKSPFKSKNVTPTTPAIKINTETPTEFKPNSKVECDATKSTVQRTPCITTPADHKLTKGTPKTSTPDNTKTAIVRKAPVAVNPSKVTALTGGPKTSTPEGNKQLPQISILSAVSSVVCSPENLHPRIPLSENLHQNRISSNSLAMQVIQEMEYAQNVVHQASSYSSVLPGKSAHNLKSSRIPVCDENSMEIRHMLPSASGLQNSQSLLNLKTVRTSPMDDHRLSMGQVMFSGALGLPQYHPDIRPTIISISEATESPQNQQNISISRIILTSPQSPKFNMQKSTLSPNSKIFSRRI